MLFSAERALEDQKEEQRLVERQLNELECTLSDLSREYKEVCCWVVDNIVFQIRKYIDPILSSNSENFIDS